jgi:predicted porin
MHKKLLAAAVAGAFVAPAAALAQSSTVQIYGAANYEYGVADQGSGRPKTDIPDTPGSNIGFRGEEKLGGNLSAWFQCETSADLRGFDQAGFCSRNSAVGFKGSFGNIFFGRWDTPFKRVMNIGTVGAEETGIMGMSFMAFGGSGGALANANDGHESNGETLQRQRFKRREAGLSYYESPMFGGFQVLAAFSTGIGAAENDPGALAGVGATGATDGTSNSHARVWSIGASYTAGPLGIGAGYEKHANFGQFNDAALTGVIVQDLDDSGWGVSAAYTFGGNIKVGGTYLERKWGFAPGVDLKKQTSTLGIEWAIVGPHSLEAQWTHAWDTKGGTATGQSIGGNGGARYSVLGDTGGDAFSIGYRYSFSKRTSIKFAYQKVDNDSQSNSVRIGNAAPYCSAATCPAQGAAPLGQSVDSFGFKIFHRF